MSTLTLRVVKSFAYRNVKNHILHNVDLTTTTGQQVLDQAREVAATSAAFRAFRTVKLDAIKIYTKAHGTKSMDLVMNLEDDERLILDLTRTLAEQGVEQETELTVFNMADYQEYKSNPEQKW